MAVVGIAGVVAVLLSVSALTRGLSGAVLATGSEERVIVLRAGATGEFSSTLLVDSVATIKDAPGVARAPDGGPAASAEFTTALNLLRKENGARAGLSVRGVEPSFMTVRPELSIVEGRAFTPGLRELLVGRGAYAEFRGVALGDEVELRNSRWTVVGVFESDGDANESSLLADAATLLSAYQRTAVNSVTVKLESPAAFDELKTALTTNPTLSVSVERESEFYLRQSAEAGNVVPRRRARGRHLHGARRDIRCVEHDVLGCELARSRDRDAACDRLRRRRRRGLGARGIARAVAGRRFVRRGDRVADVQRQHGHARRQRRPLVFEMRVTPALLGVGMLLAVSVGLVGGLFPAVRAARLPVATALRAV